MFYFSFFPIFFVMYVKQYTQISLFVRYITFIITSSLYLSQAAWPIKHKYAHTYTKHRKAKLKRNKK